MLDFISLGQTHAQGSSTAMTNVATRINVNYLRSEPLDLKIFPAFSVISNSESEQKMAVVQHCTLSVTTALLTQTSRKYQQGGTEVT